jgi:hypothetical protein
MTQQPMQSTTSSTTTSSSSVDAPAVENAKSEYGRPYHPSMVIVTQNDDDDEENNNNSYKQNQQQQQQQQHEGSPLLPNSDPKKLKHLFLNDSVLIRVRSLY